MIAAVNDTTRRYPRTEGEAFRTASWRNPVEGPYHAAHPWRHAVGWVLVLLAALTLAGVQL
jgi:hypothetical protein